MRLSDFPLLSPDILNVKVKDASDKNVQWKANAEVFLWKDEDQFWLRQEDRHVAVLPADTGPHFEFLIQRRELPWLLVRSKGDQLRLQFGQPADWLPLDEPLQICVDNFVVGQLKSSNAIEREDAALAVRWCLEEFVIEGEPRRLAAVRHDSTTPGDWQVIGRAWRADLQRDSLGKIHVRRIARSAQAVEAWSLIQGKISFVDDSDRAQLLSEAQQALLNQSIQSNGSYLELWKKYGEQEWQRSLSQAANLGVLPYRSREESTDEGGAWRFHVDPAALNEFRHEWQFIEYDDSLALEAGQFAPDWTDVHHTDLSQVDNRRRFRGRPVFESKALVIESGQSAPPEEGYLYLSLAGDRTVQERRFKARANIESGQRLPQLRYILQQVPVPVLRRAKHEALTAYARQCFKSGRPTSRQIDAIKVALDTPDIALIIGPPGTGKTQVIAALERRLSEISGGDTDQHQVLISSFQHDAVENALERTDVYGLPPVKVGEKRGRDGIDPIERWCGNQHKKVSAVVDAANEKEAHVPLLRNLHQRLAILRHAQLDDRESRANLDAANSLLEELETAHRIRLPALLRDEWRDYIAKQPDAGRTTSMEERWLSLRKVRALRVTPDSFADDGPDRAYEAYLALRESERIPEEDLRLVSEVAAFQKLDPKTAIDVVQLRDRLIDALMPDYRPPAIKHRLDADGIRLIAQLENALEDRLKQTHYGVAGVLARYRDTFVNNPERTRMTVREYAMIVGATCQQAASKGMANLKSLSGIGDTGIEFDTVIIDEAARANPLDLFIPMSMARRRLVLVGDHRQLPHLLEADLEEEVAERHALSNEQREAYSQSLFERLWRQLKAREEADGIRRVVMLDTQFRMHPILGKFISEQFYEKEKLDALKPGREAAEFLNAVPGYEGKVCAWLDVPLSRGAEDKRGMSRRRPFEVQQVAGETLRLLKACGPDVSIGVITFYSAQRDDIFEELAHLEMNVTERDTETREWRITEPWRRTSAGDERLRIGTVDAFQGKEFDIVLLSVVRSNSNRIPPGSPGDEAFEKAANHKYGHLRLNNRLNVAMSRQRSLLIAVGDRSMAQGKKADDAVPALAAFLRLCEGEHGIVC